MVCPHGQKKGVELVRSKGISFSQFCANVFYGRPLTIVEVTAFVCHKPSIIDLQSSWT